MFKWIIWTLFGIFLWTPIQAEPPNHTAFKNPLPSVTVYRSPTCGCCKAWVGHLRQNGFTVNDHVVDHLNAIKDQQKVPQNLRSCHTATVEGYTIEGHVPANDIKRLLMEKPQIAGIAVPNMPVGSPGMEMGSRKDPFDVISFNSNEEQQVFNRYVNY